MRPVVPALMNESGMAEGTALTEQDRCRHANGELTSEAAFELHSRGTAYSAVFDHPGFVPAEFLATLADGDLGYPAARPAQLAAELCAAGVWETVEGGYRVLDDEAVEVCVERVRELREEEARTAPAGAPRQQRPPARKTVGGLPGSGNQPGRARPSASGAPGAASSPGSSG